jgi:5,6-dimethylbenzimidazole synthase
LQFTPNDAAVLKAILTWRRDVRHFKTDLLPAEVVSRLKSSFDLAPSVGNARPWRIIEVASTDVRARIAQEVADAKDRAGAAYGGERKVHYDGLKLAGVDAAPLQLAVFSENDPSEGHGLGRQTMPETLYQSTVMAIHTLWLTARAENVGLGMVSILRPEVLSSLLGAPASWTFVAYLCLGHPETTSDTPLLHDVGWQQNTATTWRTV